MNNSSLHYTIIKYIIDHGYGPTSAELAGIFNVSSGEIKNGLAELAAYHGIVLHPDGERIWVIHPFSLAPTNFVVRNNGRQWWGNCAWCSLGIAALLEGATNIITTTGAEGEYVEFSVSDGRINRAGLYVHFPVPMKKAWDNVIYTCSTMLVFKNKQQVDDWCRRHRIAKGDVQPLEKIWQFSKAWYGDHLNPQWKKWTAEEAAAIFKKFNLKGTTWDIPVSKGHF